MSLLSTAPAIWSEGSAYAPEHMTKSAATMLCRRIEAYWRQRGGVVRCRIEMMVGVGSERGVSYAVRSDMVGGMPRA
jgi:hypothetical protein